MAMATSITSSGLTAVKELLRYGFEVTAYEGEPPP